MNTPIAVTELVEWILQNRKGDAFKDDSYENLIAGVQDDIANHTLLFVLDNSGHIIGVVTFDVDVYNALVYIKNIVVTQYSALAILAQHFREHFGGFALCANRNNKEIMYDTSRLINHLLKKGVR